MSAGQVFWRSKWGRRGRPWVTNIAELPASPLQWRQVTSNPFKSNRFFFLVHQILLFNGVFTQVESTSPDLLVSWPERREIHMPWTRVFILRRGVGSIVPCSFQLSVTAGVNKKPKNLFSAYYDFFIPSWKKNIKQYKRLRFACIIVLHYFLLSITFLSPPTNFKSCHYQVLTILLPFFPVSKILTQSLGIAKLNGFFTPVKLNGFFHWLLIY